jgi:Tfp pilus assembly protein PilF
METAATYLEKGDALRAEGRWEEALQCYQKVVELDPENWLAHHHAGDCCFEKQDLEKAKAFYEPAIRLNPSFYWSYCNLGRSLSKQGKIEEATIYLQKAIEVTSNFSQAYLHLEDIYLKQEKWENRLALYEQAIDVEPENLWGYIGLVKLLREKYRLEEALEKCEEGLKLDADSRELKILKEELLALIETDYKVLLVSILFFYPQERSLHFLNHVPEIIISKCNDLRIKPIFAFRNNSFNFDCQEIIAKIDSFREQFPEINFTYSEGVNIGFGGGHNLNFNQHSSDIFLVLNDDLGIPHLEAIETALIKFKQQPKLAAIGAYTTPTHIQEDFAYVPAKEDDLKVRDYAEASILFIRSSAFRKVNGFDEKMEYAYFEDSDLSLRFKQAGYEFLHIDIPHQHFRSTSALKIPEVAGRTVYEYNRARFLSRWSNYIKQRKLQGKILIALLGDGIGDLVDCYYPVAALVQEHIDRGVQVDLALGKSKLNFLYETLPVNLLSPDQLPIDIQKEYDQVYRVDDINYSPPFHTLDLIASKLGVTDFSDDENRVKNYVMNLDPSQEIINIPYLKDGNYAIAHLDSQRGGFEGRAPILKECIPALNSMAEKYPILLLGLHHPDDQKDSEYEEFIQKHDNIIDIRNQGTIQDMAHIISKAQLFFGVDSGPMHFAQLFNIPSFVMYGPIHPMTKVYRYDNSGAYFNFDSSSGSGYYHKYLEPGYYFCMRRDEQCIKFIEGEALKEKLDDFISTGFKFNWNELFNPLRYRQREWLFLQYHNPLFKNRLLSGNVLSSKGISDLIIQVCEVFENRTRDTINHHINLSLSKAKDLEAENSQLKEIIQELKGEIKGK